MNLDLFKGISQTIKQNELVKKFIKELDESLEKNENLKQKDTYYQVVDFGENSVFLQNVKNNCTSEEKDIDKEILEKLDIDTVLIYKEDYEIDEEKTEEFMNSLVDINEYRKIKEEFSNIINSLDITEDTEFELEYKNSNGCILKYDNNTLKVPFELVPFWAEEGEILLFKKISL